MLTKWHLYNVWVMEMYAKLSDAELTGLLRKGDKAAFTQIYRKYWTGVYNSAYQRLRDKEQCQDLVQNVFAAFWDRRMKIDVHDLAAYLHTAVKFQVIKYVSRKPVNSVFLDGFDDLILSPVSADDQLLEKEIIKLLELYLDSLPAKRKAIFMMHYQEDLSTAEIARRLGISQKTVQNQIHTVNQALKMRLTHLLTVIVVSSFLYQ